MDKQKEKIASEKQTTRRSLVRWRHRLVVLWSPSPSHHHVPTLAPDNPLLSPQDPASWVLRSSSAARIYCFGAKFQGNRGSHELALKPNQLQPILTITKAHPKRKHQSVLFITSENGRIQLWLQRQCRLSLLLLSRRTGSFWNYNPHAAVTWRNLLLLI